MAMKSTILNDSEVTRFILECCCASPRHILVIDLIQDLKTDPFAEVMFLDPGSASSLWARIKNAFKHVIFKEDIPICASMLINSKSISQLEEILNGLKSFEGVRSHKE
jgi:hypothetical protein